MGEILTNIFGIPPGGRKTKEAEPKIDIPTRTGEEPTTYDWRTGRQISGPEDTGAEEYGKELWDMYGNVLAGPKKSQQLPEPKTQTEFVNTVRRLNMTDPEAARKYYDMYVPLWFFGIAGYVSMLYLMFTSVLGTIKLWKNQKNAMRLGDNGN